MLQWGGQWRLRTRHRGCLFVCTCVLWLCICLHSYKQHVFTIQTVWKVYSILQQCISFQLFWSYFNHLYNDNDLSLCIAEYEVKLYISFQIDCLLSLHSLFIQWQQRYSLLFSVEWKLSHSLGAVVPNISHELNYIKSLKASILIVQTMANISCV